LTTIDLLEKKTWLAWEEDDIMTSTDFMVMRFI
jgi:hypothetical protein